MAQPCLIGSERPFPPLDLWAQIRVVSWVQYCDFIAVLLVPGNYVSAFLTLKLVHSCLLLLQRVLQGRLGQRGGSEPGVLSLGAGPLTEPWGQRHSDAHTLHFPASPPPDPQSSTLKNGHKLPPSPGPP